MRRTIAIVMVVGLLSVPCRVWAQGEPAAEGLYFGNQRGVLVTAGQATELPTRVSNADALKPYTELITRFLSQTKDPDAFRACIGYLGAIEGQVRYFSAILDRAQAILLGQSMSGFARPDILAPNSKDRLAQVQESVIRELTGLKTESSGKLLASISAEGVSSALQLEAGLALIENRTDASHLLLGSLDQQQGRSRDPSTWFTRKAHVIAMAAFADRSITAEELADVMEKKNLTADVYDRILGSKSVKPKVTESAYEKVSFRSYLAALILELFEQEATTRGRAVLSAEGITYSPERARTSVASSKDIGKLLVRLSQLVELTGDSHQVATEIRRAVGVVLGAASKSSDPEIRIAVVKAQAKAVVDITPEVLEIARTESDLRVLMDLGKTVRRIPMRPYVAASASATGFSTEIIGSLTRDGSRTTIGNLVFSLLEAIVGNGNATDEVKGKAIANILEIGKRGPVEAKEIVRFFLRLKSDAGKGIEQICPQGVKILAEIAADPKLAITEEMQKPVEPDRYATRPDESQVRFDREYQRNAKEYVLRVSATEQTFRFAVRAEALRALPKLVEANVLKWADAMTIITKARTSGDAEIVRVAMEAHGAINRASLAKGSSASEVLRGLAEEGPRVETPLKARTEESVRERLRGARPAGEALDPAARAAAEAVAREAARDAARDAAKGAKPK